MDYTQIADALTAAIIRQESGGNPNSLSKKGAMGLMQVMPDTARDPGFGVAPLKDPWNPEENKRFGRDYFAAMLQRYGGDKEAALIAYNGGPARADKWVKSGRSDAVIPEESSNYYKSVLNMSPSTTPNGDTPINQSSGTPPSLDQSAIAQYPDMTSTALATLPVPGSETRKSLAKALQQRAFAPAASPMAALGSLAQLFAGKYAANKEEEKDNSRNQAIAKAMAGAGGNVSSIAQLLLSTGDPDLMKTGMSALIASQKQPSTVSQPEKIREYQFDMQQRQQSGQPLINYNQWVSENQQNKPMTATDKKIVVEADEAIDRNKAAIGNFDQALKLNNKAYSGPLAKQRGYISSLFGSDEGENTQTLDNLAGSSAVGQLREIFGGNPTEGERKILIELAGSTNQTPKVREEIWGRAKAAAERRLKLNEDQANQIRGGTYYKPGGGRSNVGGGLTNPDQSKALAEGQAAIAQGADKAKVIERLQSLGVDTSGL